MHRARTLVTPLFFFPSHPTGGPSVPTLRRPVEHPSPSQIDGVPSELGLAPASQPAAFFSFRPDGPSLPSLAVEEMDTIVLWTRPDQPRSAV